MAKSTCIHYLEDTAHPREYKLTSADDETIPATDATPAFPVRIYAPRDKGDNLPLVVFFHGGGYISGTDPSILPYRSTD